MAFSKGSFCLVVKLEKQQNTKSIQHYLSFIYKIKTKFIQKFQPKELTKFIITPSTLPPIPAITPPAPESDDDENEGDDREGWGERGRVRELPDETDAVELPCAQS